jgi:hypothetical protein
MLVHVNVSTVGFFVAEATEKQKLLVTLTHSAVEKHQTNKIMESVEMKEVEVYIFSQF